jgi:hypothetical protein
VCTPAPHNSLACSRADPRPPARTSSTGTSTSSIPRCSRRSSPTARRTPRSSGTSPGPRRSSSRRARTRTSLASCTPLFAFLFRASPLTLHVQEPVLGRRDPQHPVLVPPRARQRRLQPRTSHFFQPCMSSVADGPGSLDLQPRRSVDHRPAEHGRPRRDAARRARHRARARPPPRREPGPVHAHKQDRAAPVNRASSSFLLGPECTNTLITAHVL